MLKLTIYEAHPWLAPGANLAPVDVDNGTGWLRKAVNMIYNRVKSTVKQKGVVTNVLHNHFEDQDKTIVRYPLVQYQRVGHRFFVTGINEGAEALEVLLEDLDRPVFINDALMLRFQVWQNFNWNIHSTPTLLGYTLTNWLGLNNADQKYQLYCGLKSAREKIAYLEEMLYNHLVKDFGKHLGLDLSGINPVITHIDSLERSCHKVTTNKQARFFQPFTVGFEVNLSLPPHVCLGNGKAYGYGLVSPAPPPA